ncbi:MAG: tyrosine-type recombinase/integrase [Legionellaceae bacterium]|nr:tyrosine-type recombinase/integrase [Legionellaceae bacterium]
MKVRIHLFKGKTYKNGNHPVILKYTINGKTKKRVLIDVHPKDWDAKNNRVRGRVNNADFLNSFISDAFSKAERELLEVKSGSRSISTILNNANSITLGQALQEELTRLEAEYKSGSYDKVLALQKQIDGDTILEHIDEKWFDIFVSSRIKAGNTGTTIRKKIVILRGLLSRYSTKQISKEVANYSIPVLKPLKQKLTPKEFDSLENLILPSGSSLEVVRDMFLMQVYLRGIRIGDILQATIDQFRDGRFVYEADKTGKSQGIKVISQANDIFLRYSSGKKKNETLFPIFRWEPNKQFSDFENQRKRLKHKEVCTTIVNANLKVLATMAGINKPLSSHIARHTFARMAIDKINNPMVTMELLGHSSLSVHQGYLNDIRKDDDLDKAADDIFS